MKRVISALLVPIALILCACAQQKDEVLVTPPPKDSPVVYITETPQLQPTSTTLPTSTVMDVFTFAGVSGEEKTILISAYYGLRDAMRNDDREFVANMIDYPIWASEYGEPVWISSKQEFLQQYDKIFTPHFIEVLSNLEINWEYFMVTDYGIFILHDDDISSTAIYFSNENIGKIYRISYHERDPKKTYEAVPSWTPYPTITLTQQNGAPTLTPTPYWFNITSGTERSMSTYYGKWIVTRYEWIGESYCNNDENQAAAQIGKKIEFLPEELIIDNGFQYSDGTDHTHIVYKIVDLEYYWYDDNITPLPPDHPDRRDDPLFIMVDSDRAGNLYEFEVTKSSRLVMSFACYWFFLDKMPD